MVKNLQTIMIAAFGGMLFSLVGIPLPWMLGSLSAILLWRYLTKAEVILNSHLRNVALIVLGLVMGKSFSQEAALRVIDQFPVIVSTTILIIFLSVAMAYLVKRSCGISLQSAILGSIPGGFSQMIVLSDEVEGAQVSIVTLMQTVRLLLVIFLVPFVVQKGLAAKVVAETAVSNAILPSASIDYRYLILCMLLALSGAVIATKIKFPTAYLIGPVIIIAALVLAGFPQPKVPSELIIAAQLLMGASVGINFELTPGTKLKKLLLLSITSNLVIVLSTFGIGYMLTQLHYQSLVTSFLSLAPGGVSEMGVTAVAVGADLALVTSYQLFRFAFIMFAVPPLLRSFFKRIPKTLPQEQNCE